MKKFNAVLLALLLAAALLTSCKQDDENINDADSTGTDTTITVSENETTADITQSAEESMNGDEFINDNEATYNDAWN